MMVMMTMMDAANADVVDADSDHGHDDDSDDDNETTLVFSATVQHSLT